MRRLTMRAITAAVAVGGALVTWGTTGLGAASAATAAGAPIPTTSQAGYVATHNTFRYIITAVKVPKASSKYDTYAEVVLGGSSYPATLGVRAGGGPNSVSFNVVGHLGGMGGGSIAGISPKVGDVLKLSIYYNSKSGLDNFTATDVTQGVTRQVTAPPTPGTVYHAAEAACLLASTPAPPKADVLLWTFTGTHVTTFHGTRGTMNGPWLTRQIIDVTSGGRVVMSPSYLWNDGKAFGTWLRAAK